MRQRLQSGQEVHPERAGEEGAEGERDLRDAEVQIEVQDLVAVVVHGDRSQLLLPLDVLQMRVALSGDVRVLRSRAIKRIRVGSSSPAAAPRRGASRSEADGPACSSASAAAPACSRRRR